MKRRIATIYLDEILVLENGRQGNSDSENIVMVSLIWPRPMIDFRTAAKPVRIEDGRAVEFAGRAFHEKILFKEIVGGPFGITIEVSERKSPTVVAQFLSSIATGLVNAAFPLPPTSETFRRIVHAGAYGMGQKIQAAPKESILRVAFGHAMIDPVQAATGRLDIPLEAPESIPAAGAAKARTKSLLTKGQPNGHAVLSYSIEED